VIVENKNLCFVEDIDWGKIKKSESYEQHNHYGPNRNATECRKFIKLETQLRKSLINKLNSLKSRFIW
jgi:hypothetical protein